MYISFSNVGFGNASGNLRFLRIVKLKVLLMTIELVPIGAGILALLVAAFLALWVNKQPKGTPKMQEIYSAIREGSYAYMKRQYKTIAIIALVLAVILYAVFDLGKMPLTSAAFLLGAFASLAAGWLSMEVATRANVRTLLMLLYR